MIEYLYEKRISHKKPGDLEGAAPFHGGVNITYHVYRDGIFVDSFLKVENMRKVLGPAKFKRVQERRYDV